MAHILSQQAQPHRSEWIHVTLGRSNLQPVPLNESLYPLQLARWLWALIVSSGSFKGLQQRPRASSETHSAGLSRGGILLHVYSHVYPYSPRHLSPHHHGLTLSPSAPTPILPPSSSRSPQVFSFSSSLPPLSSLPLTLPYSPVISPPHTCWGRGGPQ